MLLALNGNELTGAIPPELGSLVNLRVLYLSQNELTGAIPAELGELPNLTALTLRGNRLTVCIPEALREVFYSDLADLGLPFCPW